jgi:hypothetical protein
MLRSIDVVSVSGAEGFLNIPQFRFCIFHCPGSVIATKFHVGISGEFFSKSHGPVCGS